jgi:hypothetical protein
LGLKLKTGRNIKVQLKLNLDRFLYNTYKISYKSYAIGYCHNYDVPKQETKLHEKYPYIDKDIIQKAALDVIRRKYIKKYDEEFYKIFRYKLPEKIEIDLNYLNVFYDYSPLYVKKVNFEDDFIVFEGDINRLGYYITRMYNHIYNINYNWYNLQKKLLKEANEYSPPTSKIFYTKEDIYWIYGNLLHKWEEHFPTGGRELFYFDPSSIKINVFVYASENEIDEYLRSICFETRKEENPELYYSIKKYRDKEKEKEERKKQKLKTNRERLKKLSKNSDDV